MKTVKLSKTPGIKLMVTLLASGLLGLFFMSLFGKMLLPIEAFDFSVSVQPFPQGVTEIKIPPVGIISAKTHFTPIKITIALEDVNFAILNNLITDAEDTTSEKLIDSVKNEIDKKIVEYVWYLLFLAFFGGSIAAIIINGKKPKIVISSSLVAVMLALSLIFLTYFTFDSQKFRNPEFRGILKSAPWMIQMAENVLQKYNQLGEQLEIIATNLYQLYEGMNIQETMDNPVKKDEISVLLVSDIHNNVAVNRFLKQIAENFAIDFLIDLGDLTDYGTKLEGLLSQGLKEIPYPYLFVPGNHDSPEIVESLSTYPNVRIARNQMMNIAGINILPLADPLSYRQEISSPSEEEKQEFSVKMQKLWSEASTKPDLVAVHNFRYVAALSGNVPLIVHGHLHQVSIEEKNGTIIINPGSTGGAGIRGLQAFKEIPYSVVLLHFHKGDDLKLYAADIIKVYNFKKGFVLERKYFE